MYSGPEAAFWEVSCGQLRSQGRRSVPRNKGGSPDATLRAAKLALLHGSAFHNRFYWGPFQLYTRS